MKSRACLEKNQQNRLKKRGNTQINHKWKRRPYTPNHINTMDHKGLLQMII